MAMMESVGEAVSAGATQKMKVGRLETRRRQQRRQGFIDTHQNRIDAASRQKDVLLYRLDTTE